MKEIFEEADERPTSKIEWSMLRELLPRFRPHVFSLTVCGVLLIVFSLLSLAGPLLVKRAIDVNFVQLDFHGLLITAGLFLLVVLLSFTVNYIQMVKLEIVGQKIVKCVRIDIFSHLTRLPQSFFDVHPVGQLLSRVENDTESLRTMFTNTVIAILSDLIMMLGMFGVMFVLSARLALVLLAVAPFVALMVRYYNRKLVPIFLEVRRRTADVYGFLEEYLRGIRIVHAFDQEHTVSAKMDAVNKAKFDAEFPGERYSNYFGHSVGLIATISTVLVLGFGGHWAQQKPDQLTIGTLVAFLGYIDRFFGPIFHLSEQLNIIQRALAGAARIVEILHTPEVKQLTVEAPNSAEFPAPLAEGIEFQHVWFAYKGEDWVLNDVTFAVPKGRKLAIVGPTGGGKTSLISLIFRFYDPQQGCIFMHGQEIRSLPLDALRQRMGLVLQDIVFFPGSILDNLRLHDSSISEAQVWQALKTVQAEGIIERLPKGLHTELSEGAGNLSVGERQLLSFARALVFDPEILVLDEATSSVDPLTEKLLQQAVEKLLGGRTALIIAHRLETIRACDEIIVIQDGRIAEQGSHDELVALDGLYHTLYHIQSGAGRVV